MSDTIIVWDLETIPDIKGFAAATDMPGKSDDEVRAALGDKFPKLIYHSIACIGALVAQRAQDGWTIVALGAPHIGERSEKALIKAFVDRIGELKPQLVSFNGNSFDLPVLRYRAMVNQVSAPGLAVRNYFSRYTEDALDLLDVLASFQSTGKATLHEMSKMMGLAGKPDGVNGAEVEKYVLDGRIQEVADYCETDLVNTYRVFLRYDLFRGRLSPTEFAATEQNLAEFINAHRDTKQHLLDMIGG